MNTPTAIAIYRAKRFSPNAEERDKAIMDEVCKLLAPIYNIYKVEEDELEQQCQTLPCRIPHEEASLIVSMARSRYVLTALATLEDKGTRVVNSAKAILKASRSSIDRTMRENNLPAAPLEGNSGWWIKRGDEAAQQRDDVVFVPTTNKRQEVLSAFQQRGITDVVVTAHVEGDIVKFYGVEGTPFFRIFYPTDGSYTKFGDEKLNGKPLHTPFSIDNLNNDADKLAKLTGIEIYGGDAIIRTDGSYAIIDFNDWPSFSLCRKEAAAAICNKVKK